MKTPDVSPVEHYKIVPTENRPPGHHLDITWTSPANNSCPGRSGCRLPCCMFVDDCLLFLWFQDSCNNDIFNDDRYEAHPDLLRLYRHVSLGVRVGAAALLCPLCSVYSWSHHSHDS